MPKATETTTFKPEPLIIARSFPAPRAMVFQAWSTAEHMKRWFCPEGFTVPDATIDFRAGGVFDLCMRSPHGEDSWLKGHFIEVTPHDRLVFHNDIIMAGEPRFRAFTTIDFTIDAVGTRMAVRQEYDIIDPAFAWAVQGAPDGWRTTLDNLEREVASIRAAKPRVAHSTFSLERRYDAPPSKVFHALTDETAKDKWFAGGDGYTLLKRSMDVRPGGKEHLSGRWDHGMVSTFDATYFDVVPNQRLVYAYEMHLDARKISVSLATVELLPDGAGTRFIITEQGVFLDGEDSSSREKGTGFLLDRLGASLKD